MVKSVSLFLILCTLLGSSEFEKNCLTCHGDDFRFNIIMKKYTLKYSTKERIKNAMFEYLKYPSYEKSILPSEYIKKFGIKEKSELEDKILKEMLDIYYDRFNLKSKLY
ncbi:MAG: hypothetical protein A2513_08330 [Sulfurimonas sp. RIFOXYD12_FULL_33_39]|uniref:hypothetical protein n=1 Tax=unclassified Sulfurimonas TaxID=2623549 RepID=UPI0008D127E5|nr:MULTISPECIES: hypothetical protein [unclassified Sulfurimonas]OHE10093.1 MAG: hypothetical protein A2513_08330 [Sulfurimonas sp. RIFOXYD12_FULL_33_39]OHE14686.1 MAG: hypothetical protein A2530_02150 [Sulfurimonas sp. RIFOXYD2_FULL_34_21]DAB28775.1 MAG TPA: hypothetical protein CFH78_00550 [Sulfurimonas sp. UBA10385]